MNREPALIVGAVTALLGLLVAFGVPISDPQVDAILDLVVVVAPLLAAVVTRHFVTPAGSGRHRADDPA